MRIVAALLVLCVLWSGGCAGALLVPAGMSALEAGSMGFGALQNGSAVWSRRAMVSHEPCTLEDAITAAHSAMEKLAFLRGVTVVEGREARASYRDMKDTEVVITMESRTPRVTRVAIRIGFWGNQTMSLLLLNAIKIELAADETDPGEGPPAEEPGETTDPPEESAGVEDTAQREP